jgi:hypothetical protein
MQRVSSCQGIGSWAGHVHWYKGLLTPLVPCFWLWPLQTMHNTAVQAESLTSTVSPLLHGVWQGSSQAYLALTGAMIEAGHSNMLPLSRYTSVPVCLRSARVLATVVTELRHEDPK